MRNLLLSLGLALCAQTAAADVAEDFNRLVAALPGLPLEMDTEKQAARTKSMVAGLAGTWVTGQMLQAVQDDDAFVFPDAEGLAGHCERLGMQITPTGELSFDVTRRSKTASMTFHLQWVGGSSFLSSANETEMLEFVFGKDYRDKDIIPVYRTLATTAWLGEFDVTQASPDLLLLQFPRGPVDFLVRCPSGQP